MDQDRNGRRARVREFYRREEKKLKEGPRPKTAWEQWTLRIFYAFIGLAVLVLANVPYPRSRFVILTICAYLAVVCFRCSKEGDVEFHHPDFSTPGILLSALASFVVLEYLHHVSFILVFPALLVFMVVGVLASAYAQQVCIRARYYEKHGLPRFETLDNWDELEKKITEGQPYALYLRAFSEETPSGFDWDMDTNIPNEVRVDTRFQFAIRKFLAGFPTYCLLNPGDPVHRTSFVTVLADPENWVCELKHLLSGASFAVILYEYSSSGLNTEIDLIAANAAIAEKTILISGPWVKKDDEKFGKLSSVCRWWVHLDLSGESTDDGWPDFFVRAPPEVTSWVDARRLS